MFGTHLFSNLFQTVKMYIPLNTFIECIMLVINDLTHFGEKALIGSAGWQRSQSKGGNHALSAHVSEVKGHR